MSFPVAALFKKKHLVKLSILLSLSASMIQCQGSNSDSNSVKNIDKTQLVKFPREFADGIKLLFQKQNTVCEGGNTKIWGTTSHDQIEYYSFQVVEQTLIAKSLATGATLFSLPILSADESFITVDFLAGFTKITELETKRDEAGNPILGENAFGSEDGIKLPAQPEPKDFDIVPGTASVRSIINGEQVLVNQALKLVSLYRDAYAPAAFICEVQYSFSIPQKSLDYEPLVLADEAAAEQFFTDDNNLAQKMNLNRPIVMHVEEGTPPAVQVGIAAGVNYWNMILGRKLFVLGEPMKRSIFSLGQNIIGIPKQRIMGAGAGSNSDPETGEMIVPGFEFQIPVEFVDDPLPSSSDPLDLKISREIARLTAHELGHALGLQHNFETMMLDTSDPETIVCVSVMCYATAKQGQVSGQKLLDGKLRLDYDVKAIDYLYGKSDGEKVLPGPFKAPSF